MPKLCGTSPSFTVCTNDRKVVNPTANTSDNRLSSNDNYSYDYAGNTTADAQGRTFIYDAENKQTKVTNSSGTLGEYLYDGDGKRVKKVSAAEETIFVYDAAGKMIAEYSTALNPTPQVSYLTNDHLGSPRINTDEKGAVISRHDYQPFGEEINQGRNTGLQYQDDAVRKQFTSYERDTESDLDFAQARMYHNKLGRFTTVDPIFSSADPARPQTWNRYTYCLGNPYKFIDPQGLIWTYTDSSDGKTRTFVWYDNEKDVPENSNIYKGSNYFIGADEALFLGAKGKWERVSREEGALGQIEEFLRGPDSPLSKEDKEKLERAFMDRIKGVHWEDDFVASLAGGALGQLGEAGLKGLAGLLLRSGSSQAELATMSGMLRDAAAGKGNFGIGSATVDEAEAMGKAWVGNGYTVASDGTTLVSADKLRQFRPPSFKPGNVGSKFGPVQANLESRVNPLGQWQANAHIDIPIP